MRLVVAAFVIVFSSTAARCDMFDGNELYDICKRSPDILNPYVAGVVDKSIQDSALAEFWAPDRASKDNLKKAIRPFCIPDGVKLDQMRDVVCKYFADVPKNRHTAGSALVQTALAEAFPCH